VQDGCDYKCSYCTIHAARGASRNIAICDIVGEAKNIALRGIREIVITGVNTGDFGRTTGEQFIDLLRELDKVDGIERYRISSIEPNLLTDEILRFCANSTKFQPHFHIPLQSGSDRILGLMRRRYTTAKFADRVASVRKYMPDAFIGIDVIVGFPSETDEDFETTFNFLEQIQPSYLHIFPFSERTGTDAAQMVGKVKDSVKTERAARLGALCQELEAKFYSRFAGTEGEVLWESTIRGGQMTGYTGNYLKITAPYQKGKIGTIEKITIPFDI
jgi:threonylcarbamoyladenosine tRNA methylthiotransferase MtaB